MARPVWSNHEPLGPQSTADNRGRPVLVRPFLRAGEHAPHFRLLDQHGHMVTLNALLAKGAVVLRFCRHDGTAPCFRELDALIAIHAEIDRRSATLAAIAAQPLDPHSYAFPLLTDRGGRVAQTYGLTYKAPRVERSPATSEGHHNNLKQPHGAGSAPATYVIDREGGVALAFIDLDGSSRLEPDQILMALECLGSRT